MRTGYSIDLMTTCTGLEGRDRAVPLQVPTLQLQGVRGDGAGVDPWNFRFQGLGFKV